MAVAKRPVKKVATPKTKTVSKHKGKTEAPAWNTIHIFGYGESQVIGNEANGKVANGDLKMLAPLLTVLAKKQQKGTKITLEDTHVLNIFNGAFVDFRPRGMKNKGQRFAWNDINTKTINKLADELISKVPKEKAGGKFLEIFMKNSRPTTVKNRIQAKTKKSVGRKAN